MKHEVWNKWLIINKFTVYSKDEIIGACTRMFMLLDGQNKIITRKQLIVTATDGQF